VKWPNDIYLNDRKAAGILIECSTDANGFAVAGIGVNVNHSREDFPEELITRATSLREASAKSEEVDRQKVAVALLRQLDRLYCGLAEDFPALVAEAEARSILIGRQIEMRGAAGTGTLRGIAEGLEPDGSLRIRTEDGLVQTLSGGEVSICGWW
jgi:BirA family biotin operon repressor/biotin-[acetyl-CoA-carboxylase] ligase